ncbi:MAG: hypothetical protein MUO85_10765 [candidate division Zixibacteria bacterium]|nr:hypothetical protein [candidate division Zixibacteria bacterium]
MEQQDQRKEELAQVERDNDAALAALDALEANHPREERPEVTLPVGTTADRFAAWLESQTQDAPGLAFRTERGVLMLQRSVGRRRTLQGWVWEIDGSWMSNSGELRRLGAMIDFRLLPIGHSGDERLEVRARCLNSNVRPYFDRLVSAIGATWPSDELPAGGAAAQATGKAEALMANPIETDEPEQAPASVRPKWWPKNRGTIARWKRHYPKLSQAYRSTNSIVGAALTIGIDRETASHILKWGDQSSEAHRRE